MFRACPESLSELDFRSAVKNVGNLMQECQTKFLDSLDVVDLFTTVFLAMIDGIVFISLKIVQLGRS